MRGINTRRVLVALIVGSTNPFGLLRLALILFLLAPGLWAAQPVLTFFGWSDQHTKTSGDTSSLQPFVDAMNTMPDTDWPEQIGGKIAKPSEDTL